LRLKGKRKKKSEQESLESKKYKDEYDELLKMRSGYVEPDPEPGTYNGEVVILEFTPQRPQAPYSAPEPINPDAKLETVPIPIELARMSKTIENVIDDMGYEAGMSIPLATIPSLECFTRVFDYCKHHHENPPKPVPRRYGEKKKEYVDPWDGEFFDKISEPIQIMDVLLMANYLGIQSLLDKGCKRCAEYIKGKSVEDIRRAFHIVNDFTPEEEAAAIKENEWCKDEN